MKISAYYLQTLQNRIDIVGHNIANGNTIGFKETLQSLEEAFDTRELSNTVALFGGVMPEVDYFNIQGNLYHGKRLDLSQGALLQTDNPLDLAVNGTGFFQVRTPDGRIGFTRTGIFMLDARGQIVNNQGMLLEPENSVPLILSIFMWEMTARLQEWWMVNRKF